MIKALKRAHPLVVFSYFLGLLLLAPFSRHPWMTGVQMICLCLLYLYHNRSLKKFLPFTGLIVIVAVTNPIFVQRGRTILYADAHLRITKEALLYGIHYGCVLVNLLLVFSIYKEGTVDLSVRTDLPQIRSCNFHGIWIDSKIPKTSKEDFKDTQIFKIRKSSAACDEYSIDGNDMGI